MIRYHFTSDWYHFYVHQIYIDFTANNEINVYIHFGVVNVFRSFGRVVEIPRPIWPKYQFPEDKYDISVYLSWDNDCIALAKRIIKIMRYSFSCFSKKNIRCGYRFWWIPTTYVFFEKKEKCQSSDKDFDHLLVRGKGIKFDNSTDHLDYLKIISPHGRGCVNPVARYITVHKLSINLTLLFLFIWFNFASKGFLSLEFIVRSSYVVDLIK